MNAQNLRLDIVEISQIDGPVMFQPRLKYNFKDGREMYLLVSEPKETKEAASNRQEAIGKDLKEIIEDIIERERVRISTALSGVFR